MDKISFGLNGAILSRKYLWRSVLKGNASNSTRYSMFKSVGEYAHYMHVVKKKKKLQLRLTMTSLKMKQTWVQTEKVDLCQLAAPVYISCTN